VQAKPVLLVLGDSLSAAFGMPKEQGWVTLLAAKPEMVHIKVVNASISGETTSGGKQRFPKLMAEHQPKWLILELGANDALRGQNLKHTKQNLQHIIETCLTQSCQVLLLGTRLPTNYGPAYDLAFQRMYQQLARKNDLLIDPFFLKDVVLNEQLMQKDGLHPNALAQPMILKRLNLNIKQLINNEE